MLYNYVLYTHGIDQMEPNIALDFSLSINDLRHQEEQMSNCF